MTYKVDLLVVAQEDSEAIPSPSGLAAGATRFTIIDASGATVQSQDADGLEATFTGLADGTFTATAQRLDTAGALLGDAVSTSFVDGSQVPTGPTDPTQPTGATFVPLASLTATVTPE